MCWKGGPREKNSELRKQKYEETKKAHTGGCWIKLAIVCQIKEHWLKVDIVVNEEELVFTSHHLLTKQYL
jgi:hypothetical protein